MKKIIFSIILFCFSISLNATTFYVTNTNDSGPGSLRAAVDSVQNIVGWLSGEIRISPALISNGSDTISLSSTINISSPHFRLNGVYSSTDTLYISGQNMYRIFNISSCFDAVLDSLVLIDGYTSGDGGAIYCINENFIFSNSIIRNCNAYNGGGIAIQYQSSFCAFDYSPNSNTSIINSTIENCSANNNGGAIHCETPAYISMSWGPQPSQCGLFINNSNIISNNSANYGGGIYYNSILYQLYPAHPATNAISNLSIKFSSIANNVAAFRGGGVYSKAENFHTNLFSHSTVANNISNGIGGGIFNDLDNIFGENELLNSTICYNNSIGQGKGIFNLDINTITTIKGSIFALNGANSFNQNINNHSSTNLLSHNILEDIYPNFGTNFFLGNSTSINLGTLQNNGGNTLTILPLVGSVAINNGDSSDITNAQNLPISDGLRDIGAAETACITIIETNILDTLCENEGFTLPVNSDVINLYQDTIIDYTFKTSYGCDSIIHYFLHIIPNLKVTIKDTICLNDNFTFFDGIIFNNAIKDTVRSNTYVSSNQCDSTFVQELYIRKLNSNDYAIILDTFCYNTNYTLVDGQVINLKNDTNFIYSTCEDSIFYKLSVFENFAKSENITLCSSSNYLMPDGTVYNSINISFTHLNSLFSQFGCDSSILTDITVIDNGIVNEYDTLCSGDSFIFYDETSITNLTESINHYSFLSDINGCDSIINNIIIVPQLNDSVSKTSTGNIVILKSLHNLSTYQWYDCLNDSLIIGATNQSFSPQTNGNFKVLIFKDGCEAFSDCIVVKNIGLSINNEVLEKIKIYPNPTSKKLIVEGENLDYEFQIFNITGKEIYLGKEKSKNKIILNTENLTSGVYLLHLKNQISNQVFKFVKE